MKWTCFPKFYSPLANWPWLRISPHNSLNVIYCLILTAWQLLMSFAYMPCIPMQIKPNKSPLRNRLKALLLWEIGHLSSPSRSCLGRLILIHGGQGGSVGGTPPPLQLSIWAILKKAGQDCVHHRDSSSMIVFDFSLVTWNNSQLLYLFLDTYCP